MKSNKLNIVSVIGLIFLLFSTISFAEGGGSSDDEYDSWQNKLSNYVKQDDVKGVEDALEGNDHFLQRRFYFSTIPSLEVSKKFLQKMETVKFLTTVFNAYGGEKIKQKDDLIEQLFEEKLIDANLLLRAALNIDMAGQENMVRKALSKGAKFSEIKICKHQLFYLPSAELANIIFENTDNSIDPDIFLHWVVDASCKKYSENDGDYEIDDERVRLRNGLIDLAFEKGAHSNMVLEALFGHYEVTGRKDLIKKALNKGAKFSGIRTHNFHRFPSLEEAKMMFANKNNSVDTDEFLYWILKTDCKAHNYDEQEMVISDELLELQSNLIDLAFANGVNLSKIGFSEGLPTHRACEKLIEHGMKPDDLVKQLARVILITTKEKNLQTGEWEDVYKLNDKDIAERDSLIKFAIEKGAKPTEPDNSWMLKILDLIRKIDDQLPNDYKRNSCNDDYITDFAGSIANEDGKTLLMLFAENGNFWLVKYFLDRKTTSSKEDNNGKTASMLAKDAGHTEIVKLLQAKEKPADPDEL